MKLIKLFSWLAAVCGLLYTSVLVQGQTSVPTPGVVPGASLSPQNPATVATQTFTYQGNLKKTGVGVNGVCDFQFSLFDDANAGNDIGDLTITNTNMVNGQFTVNLTFNNAFDGNPRWLSISTRCPGGTGLYTMLSPRQAINAVPQAYSLVPGAIISGSLFNELSVVSRANLIGNPMSIHAVADGPSNLSIIKPVGVFGESHTGYGLYGSSDNLIGVGGFSSSTQWPGIFGSNTFAGDGVRGETTTGNGVFGSSISGNGVQGNSSSGNGVVAISISGYGITTTSSSGYAIYATSGGGGVAAIYGSNTGGGYAVSGVSGNIGVYAHNTSGGGTAYLGSGCCAGDFYGTVNVSNGAKNWVMDDPLDPANKTLQHAAVEAPNMLNFYNGSVLLDAKGEAVVQLPAYFNAINKDYQYQLTAIGAPEPNLYIAEEITGNHFRIAGGKPGMKVSWQVTGVRNDPWAAQHPYQAEQDKPAAERGSYYYPQGYGQPITATIQMARYGSQQTP